MLEFQSLVLKFVSRIPRGKVTTYKELARALGRPRAYRAVGNALSKKPHPLRIPCHRVVRSDGKIGKYMFGGERKAKLLTKEGIEVKGGKLELEKYMFRFKK